MTQDLTAARVSYERDSLDDGAYADTPYRQFGAWFEEALKADMIEPYAMTVATVDANGQPSARVVLLRGWDDRGFVFFTNYQSQKGREIGESPRAALLFYWPPLERQVRVEGPVARLEPAESDAYFAKRPRGHRLSAWASHQSAVVPDRSFLEAQMAEFEARFPTDDVPRPEYWGGFRVAGDRFEFWQGRRNRLHDRIGYRRGDAATPWIAERLSP